MTTTVSCLLRVTVTFRERIRMEDTKAQKKVMTMAMGVTEGVCKSYGNGTPTDAYFAAPKEASGLSPKTSAFVI